VSISEAPIRMGSVGRRICSRTIIFILPSGRDSNAASCN
jgi:hypothetical protein